MCLLNTDETSIFTGFGRTRSPVRHSRMSSRVAGTDPVPHVEPYIRNSTTGTGLTVVIFLYARLPVYSLSVISFTGNSWWLECKNSVVILR